jgi:tetratricopeptide (TPR) repeat protein
MGRHEEAASTMRRTRELDPLAPIAHALSSQVAFQARDYTAALEHAQRSVLIDSQFWIGHLQVAQDYGELGEIDLALEALGDAARLSGGNSKTMALRGYLLAKRGRTQEAREVLSGLEARSLKRYVPPYNMALVHAGLGQRVAVFEWLDKAYAERDVNLMFVTVDPKWDPYRNDPRFVALLERAGFARTTTIAR